MTKTIIVTGGSGQLGQSIRGLVGSDSGYLYLFPNREELNLNDCASIDAFFAGKEFDLIINCAAYTAVDQAEAEPELADQINHMAVNKLAKMVASRHARLIHISTDYVFAGENFKPYIESDKVAPQGEYGFSKLRGEQAIESLMPNNALIIRTSWVYSAFGNNFVKTMLKLASQRDELNVIYDQVGTPTYAADLAQAIIQITQSDGFNNNTFKTELYHYSNEGVCSWYDFAITIFELSGVSCRVLPIETKDYPTPAKRPHYSVLNKAKIKQAYGIQIPYWKEALQRCLKVLEDNH
ncbi:MAG: dTDP-4-dehydrorhamnose reductase [Cycloclasticus sp.]|uniref:dTDP-4-dehydrorhamnose reductase n=1 Tax=Cycloclasticus sp. TaxID=2024830 RepID=UPI00257CDCF6|nr:dTDP-4-dehydrorhamnose reductase [Cycloclasticus sp.]MBV1899634.1 dTDP-4-dehydrorhamnose reductase [Cycloclasticus sp.]